jgi:hypothetical protein
VTTADPAFAPTTYPADKAARQVHRDRLRASALARAEDEIRRLGRSIRCSEGDHRRTTNVNGKPMVVGCANDGTTCVCECHDPKEPTP